PARTTKPFTGHFTTPASSGYDGTAAADVLTRTLNGVIGTDAVSLTGGAASFANKNVGSNKTVTLSGATLSGGEAGNYSVTSVGTQKADITAKPVTGNFTTPASKVYDTTAAAAVTNRS